MIALGKYYTYFETIQSAIEEYEDGVKTDSIRASLEELYFTIHPALSASIRDLNREKMNKSLTCLAVIRI